MKTSIATIFLAYFLLQAIASMNTNDNINLNQLDQDNETAFFAGGCFWCVEADFEKNDGVIDVVSGYTGGQVDNPTYKQVTAGGTGHFEAVMVVYNPRQITFEKLLDIFWHHIDPTDSKGQFVDRGDQYRSAIFYKNDEQKHLAETSKKNLNARKIFAKTIQSEILPLGKFYAAEDYHQNYYKKNPLRYKWYRSGSGRDQFLKKIWKNREIETARQYSSVKNGKTFVMPGDDELKRQLTPIQYRVARKNATEQPFKNKYWNNHEPGIYVDIISGEPLFSSLDKFDSGTGWPSFTQPLEGKNIVEIKDNTLFMVRTEVRSRLADSHLGHVFDDGPTPTGLRYCINSAALKFISVQNLEKESYGIYMKLFKK